MQCNTCLPKAKLIAKYFGGSDAETNSANTSPGSIVQNFQTSFVRLVTSNQSHWTTTKITFC